MRHPAILAVLGALAAPGFAGGFDGVYKQGPAWDCGLVGVDGGALMVRDGIFHGVEMQCRMENPVSVRGMDAVLYDMACSGEGSAWTARALFMTAADGGLIMVWNGYAFQYDRCPDPNPAAAGQ
ncbi:hypothetical protein [Actibacterium sp. MT2.3-13A]|uniref:hypothetical protein n=1 Tax=Actibacterium sp. MT2.3-13A TaxID=2828332 RepID=UPI0020128BBF|nr:hypothetical protein [Actibacterium sp. MT2.3-13A]